MRSRQVRLETAPTDQMLENTQFSAAQSITPYSGDKGADVVAYQRQEESSGLLIQVKQRKEGSKASGDAVDEIVAAKPFYEKKCGMPLQLIVVSNREFTRQARRHGEAHHVKVHGRKWLKNSLKERPVTWSEVNRCQFQTG